MPSVARLNVQPEPPKKAEAKAAEKETKPTEKPTEKPAEAAEKKAADPFDAAEVVTTRRGRGTKDAAESS